MFRLFLFPLSLVVLVLLAAALYGGAVDAPSARANHDDPYPSPPTPCQPGAITLISTGLNGIGGTDPLWASVHEGVFGQPAVASGPAFGISKANQWVLPGGTNNWIDPNTTGGNFSDPAGLYVYETSFSVSSGTLSFTLNFNFAVDNDVKLYLENPLGALVSLILPVSYVPTASDLSHFNTTHNVNKTVPSPFPGIYRLVAEVTNEPGPFPGSGNPTGLLVQGILTCEPALAPCAPPPAGLVSWWPLDETIGSTVEDIGPAGLDGTTIGGGITTGGPTSIVGKVRTALEVTTNRWVEVTPSAQHDFGTGDFSVDAWVRVTRATQTEPIVNKHSGTAGGYELEIAYLGGLWYLRFHLGSQFLTGPQITAPQGSWVFVAAVRSGPTVTLYVDASTPVSGNTFASGSGTSTSPLLMGRQQSNPHAGLGLDEVELFDQAITPNDIAAIYDAGSTGKCRTVGGAVELFTDVGSQASFPAPTPTAGIAGIAGIAAATIAVLTLGAWYTRRRLI